MARTSATSGSASCTCARPPSAAPCCGRRVNRVVEACSAAPHGRITVTATIAVATAHCFGTVTDTGPRTAFAVCRARPARHRYGRSAAARAPDRAVSPSRRPLCPSRDAPVASRRRPMATALCAGRRIATLSAATTTAVPSLIRPSIVSPPIVHPMRRCWSADGRVAGPPSAFATASIVAVAVAVAVPWRPIAAWEGAVAASIHWRTAWVGARLMARACCVL